jgi:hypothetical protein
VTPCASRFGHRFEARWDEVELPPVSLPNWLLITMDAAEVRTLMVRRVYVRDVCRRCGAGVERDTNGG